MNTNTNYTYETEIPDTLLADLPEEAGIRKILTGQLYLLADLLEADEKGQAGYVWYCGDHCDGDTGRFWPDALSVFL